MRVAIRSTWWWFVLGVRSEWLRRIVLWKGGQPELAFLLSSLAVGFSFDRVESHLFFVRRPGRLRRHPPTAVSRRHVAGSTADAAASEAVEASREE